MRSVFLGVVILMALPAYAAGQQRNSSERSATGRTAVAREKSTQPTPSEQATRRAERRGETTTPASREDRSGDADQPRARGERRESTPSAAAETARGRWRDQRPQAVPARTPLTNSLRSQGRPVAGALPARGLRPIPDRDHRRPGQWDRNYRYRYPYGGSNVVFVPYAVTEVVDRHVVTEAPSAPVIVEPPAPARLILDIHPPTAQVFAAGYYIGLPEDFRFEDGGAVLETGPHRIDIIADGYEPVSFDVNLARGQSATFRHNLTPITRAPQREPDAAAKTPPAEKQPVMFYLIPGCYMGNVPPKEANLPATCDLARSVSVRY